MVFLKIITIWHGMIMSLCILIQFIYKKKESSLLCRALILFLFTKQFSHNENVCIMCFFLSFLFSFSWYSIVIFLETIIKVVPRINGHKGISCIIRGYSMIKKNTNISI